MNKELLQQALKKAFQLGQTYWQQADSDYESEHRKSDVTAATFKQLFIDTESAIAQPEQPANSAKPVAVVAEVHMSRYTLEWTNGPLPEGTKLYTIS